MNELVFNSIAIVSRASGTAKFQEFKKGINVVTSPSSKKGNWIGKSSLLQSLYHTLGADALFKDPWEREGKYFYILDFSFNHKQYLMVRYERLFRLFNDQKKELFSVMNRSDLSKKLSKVFNIRMKLKDHSPEKKYIDADPAFWYLFNYYDQMKPEVSNFDSFAGLNKFYDFYSDVIYSHLGVRNDSLYSVIEEIGKLEKQVSDHTTNISRYRIVYDELYARRVPIINEKAIRDCLERYERDYKSIVEKLNNSHAKLEEYYKTKAELEALVDDIDKMIMKQKCDIKDTEHNHICPHCGSELIDGRDYYFRRVKDIDGFGTQRLEIDMELALCEKQIETELSNYNSLSSLLKSFKRRIENNERETKVGDKELFGIALSDMTENLIKKIGEEETVILDLNEQVKEAKKLKRKLLKVKADVDSCYIKNYNSVLNNYSLPATLNGTSIKAADSKIKVPGNENHIAKIVWLSSLISTRQETNKEYPVFPVVFDNPNNADFDAENEHTIFCITFDLIHFSKQVITSLVGFNRSEYACYKDINIITLENDDYHLLSKNDFEIVKNKYSFLKYFGE